MLFLGVPFVDRARTSMILRTPGKMKFRSRILPMLCLAALAPFLNGCLLFPHHVTVTPRLTGRVHRDGQPVENATLYVVNGSEHCFESDISSRTNREGRFSLERRKKTEYVVMMDRVFRFRVCIAEGGRRYQAWNGKGLGYPRPDMTLDCDLASEPVDKGKQDPGSVRGICRDITAYDKNGNKR